MAETIEFYKKKIEEIKKSSLSVADKAVAIERYENDINNIIRNREAVSSQNLRTISEGATSAKQDTGNTSLSSIDSKLTNPLPVSGSFYPETQPVSAVSLPLPTGASTAANQATEIASLSSIDAGTPAALGQTTMSASMPVAIASNQSAIPITMGSEIPKNYFFEISRGNVAGASTITKFGLNDDVDIASVPEDLWGTSGVYVQPTAARVHNFVSTQAGDTMTILIRGINSSYNAQSETITMNGTTPVATANSYYHIHLIQNTGAANNTGVITGTAAVDGTVTINMPIGYNQSVSSIYMVPVGYKGYIMRCRGRMANATANSGATLQLLNKPFGSVFQVKTQMGLNNAGSSFVELDYTNSTPFIVQAKSMTKINCIAVTNNNTSVEGEYDLILIQD